MFIIKNFVFQFFFGKYAFSYEFSLTGSAVTTKKKDDQPGGKVDPVDPNGPPTDDWGTLKLVLIFIGLGLLVLL